MGKLYNKTNAPYLIAGAFATLTLITSVTFAIAPYVWFLSSVAALSIGLPFIVGGAVFSAVAIALSSYKIISNNKKADQKLAAAEKEKHLESQVAKSSDEKEREISERKQVPISITTDPAPEVNSTQESLTSSGVSLPSIPKSVSNEKPNSPIGNNKTSGSQVTTAIGQASASTTIDSTQELSPTNNKPVKIDTPNQQKSLLAVPIFLGVSILTGVINSVINFVSSKTQNSSLNSSSVEQAKKQSPLKQGQS